MANYRAVSTGVWSALARWQDNSTGSFQNSTVLPSVADVVYANNFTVTLDIDITVLELRTGAATGVNSGGLFDCGAGSNITGNIIAGTTPCLRNNTSNNKTITGNVNAGSGSNANGINNSTASGLITINGNITGGSGVTTMGLRNSSTGIVVVNGTCTGGTGTSGPAGIYNEGSGSVTVNGVCVGGTGGVGGVNFASGTFILTKAIASTVQNGFSGTSSAGTTIVTETENGSNGIQALVGFVRFSNTGVISHKVTKQNLTTVVLVDASTGNPVEADVRQGTTYASGALTGTLIVPNPANVASGVPTDNTVGTAALTPADFWDYLTSGATPGSMGERVSAIPNNPASVESTGAQIASFNV